MLTSTDNPPVQSPADIDIHDMDGTWWVAHTRPRQEKALAWDLKDAGLSYFLPMTDRVHRSRGRRWRSRVVLFTGYIFVCCPESRRHTVFATHRVANMIPVVDQLGLVGDLTRIRRLLDTDMPITAHTGLKPGSACRITSGALSGLEGKLIQRRRRTGSVTFIVEVAMLGQGASVEIDADLIEPCAAVAATA